MTPRQILLVKTSFHAAAPQREALAGVFFADLFAREPSLRLLFPGDLTSHGQKLYGGLSAIVESIGRIHPIIPVLEWLAIRNARRGVGERHYAAVGEALMSALEAGLGGGFTPEVRQAWTAAQILVADRMSRALESEPIAA
jgi:hemoglobin-like flavoprotein